MRIRTIDDWGRWGVALLVVAVCGPDFVSGLAVFLAVCLVIVLLGIRNDTRLD